MGIDAIITLAVIVLAMVLFATEFLPVDVVAISLIVVLVTTGVISAEQGIRGFANNATLTVAAMFVLSNALIKTRVIEAVGPRFARLLGRGYGRALGAMAALIGGMSAFVNNTPVVATFIPIVSTAARQAKKSPSRYLMPLSFVAIFGGLCTLIGTSTNLLVSGIAEDNGLEPFSMFLMAPLGLIFMGVGLVYMLLVGKRLLPKNVKAEGMRQAAAIRDFLTEIKVVQTPEEGRSSIAEIFRREGLEVTVLRLKRGNELTENPATNTKLQENDVLLVQGDMDRITKIVKSDTIAITEDFKYKAFPEEETKLLEVVLLTNSELAQKKLENVDFLKKYQANVLAIRRGGKERFTDLQAITLRPGDVLLLQTNQEGYKLLKRSQNKEAPFLSMRETELGDIKTEKLLIVAATIAGVILLASLQLVPIVVGALGGIVLLNIAGVITMQDAYRAIDWQVVFLLAGALSLEKAMRASGVAESLADFMITTVGREYGPRAVVSVLYLTTSVFTELMSNNAAAALLAPIAISIAGTMGIAAQPLLLAVAFAGSASFMTPVGYQTNTMVYSAGNYRFHHFMRVGTPLNLIFWALATALLPLLYPF